MTGNEKGKWQGQEILKHNNHIIRHMKKFKVKFREVKSQCRQIVRNYRNENDDRRKFPEFNIGCLSADASQGYIQFSRKGEVSDENIAYNSIAELAIILEAIGKEWDATNQ